MKEFLKKLGIDYAGHYTDDNEYVIELEDSNQYSRVFSKLDQSLDVRDVEDDSEFDLEKNVLKYESEDYEMELSVDLDKDKYSLTVREKTED